MASPVDTSVKHFYNTMQGAPVLAGQAGSLIALLDACLVTGWGLKAVDTAVISNGVCRLNFASGKSGAEIDAVILVAGATPADLNGEQKVTAVAAGWVEFKTALPDGSVTGSVNFKMAAAGWTKPFSGINLAVYQSPNAQSTKMFVRVDDTGTMTARLRGYETMTDVNTGGGMFPLDAQIPGGQWFNKSSVANVNPVKWRVIANDRSVMVNTTGYCASAPLCETGRTVFMGDIQAGRPGGDPYAFILGGGTSGSYSDNSGVCDGPADFQHYTPRSYTALGTAIVVSVRAEIGGTAGSGVDTTFGVFPNVVDGGLRLSRRIVMQSSASTGPQRGVIPGIYSIPQSEVGLTFASLAKIPGRDSLQGRNLMTLGIGASSTNYPSASLGISCVDITGPWSY